MSCKEKLAQICIVKRLAKVSQSPPHGFERRVLAIQHIEAELTQNGGNVLRIILLQVPKPRGKKRACQRGCRRAWSE